MYNLDQIANMYGTSNENARRWAIAFAEFLSEGANPPDHRKRLMNDDDLTVFSLIAEMRAQGHVFDTIKTALADGERGAAPATPAAVVPADKTKLAKLQADVNRLTEVIQQMEADSREQTGQNKLLREQLEKTQVELRRLEGENAVLKYRLNDANPRKE